MEISKTFDTQSKVIRRRNLKFLNENKFKIKDIKGIINCILENGAYSRKNEQKQLAKGHNNYNEKENTIVSLSWKYRNYLGRQMQDKFIEMVQNDTEFLNELEEKDKILFDEFQVLTNGNNKSSG